MELLDYEREHLSVLRSRLAECTVLLRYDGSFPLENPCRIAAYGSGVRHTIKGGTGSGEVNSRFFVNVEDGLRDAGFELTTGRWLDAYDGVLRDARKQFIADLRSQAKAAGQNVVYYGMGKVMPEPDYDLPLDADGDAAVYVVSRISGEGNDRVPAPGDVMLTESETRDILYLNSRFERFMLVLNVGGPVDLSGVSEVGNILILSQLGVETDSALADILLGKAYPSGKLATTWTAWSDYPAVGDFGDPDDTHYREGIYVGYRWFDSVGKRAMYPFGYGLGYTTFSAVTESVRLEGSSFCASVRVRNTGSFPGRETVQLYLSCPEVLLDKPYQQLAAFAKTDELAPGGECVIDLSFDLRDQASYDTKTGAYILEYGDYIVRIGCSSTDTVPAAVIYIESSVTVFDVRRALGDPGFEDYIPESPVQETLPEGIPVLTLSEDAVATATAQYGLPEEIDPEVTSLTDEELAYLAVGAFDPKAGLASVIGSAGGIVAGTAGETTSVLKDKGFVPLVMADGPAGVRISRDFYRDAKGSHPAAGISLPDSMADLLSPFLKFILKLISGRSKPPKGAVIEHQYCTAIPIGTALAQSWNTDLVKRCGDIVGAEMERFGIHLWLAPALNIHRSILCGRNFEYFSEDPLISGSMAAALTEGVQSHPGCGVTIKHYASNNQETNRYGNNSLVSERAMREIYLRGFEICVRNAHPAAVMTSYNLLNGVHTAQRRDLIQDILRSEFGFDGLVMTDWVVGAMMNRKADRHPAVVQHLTAAAGSDLFMPGSSADYKDILSAVKSGALSRKQLEITATRLLRAGRKLAGARQSGRQ